jgi:hypothetical protein
MFFKRFWQIFSFKNCFTDIHSTVSGAEPERAVAFHNGQLHFRAGRMQKTGPL